MRLPDFGAKVMGLAADALFPRLCPGCGNRCDRPGRYLCWSCFSGIELFTDSLCDCCGRLATGEVGHRFVCSACRHIKPSFDRARSAGHFTGLLQHLLHQFKYSSALWLRNDLTDLLEGCLRAHFDAEQIDAVTHMNHSVTGDGIDLTVGPTVGTDRTREIRLLMENVIPLKHHR